MASTVETALKRSSFSAPKSSDATRALLLPLYAVFCVLSVLPIFLVEHPPILDFANHTARLFLACNLDQPTIAQMYQYRLGVIPNLAVDLINLPLCNTVPAAMVVKGATAGALGLIYLSGWLIQRRLFGAPNAFLLMLPAFAWNLVTTMGYTNYLVGIALTFLLLALTIGREDRRLTMLVLCNLFGVAIFFSHIFALLFALVLFFGIALGRADLKLKLVVQAGVRTALLFFIPLLLILLVPSDGEALSLDYRGKLRLLLAAFMTPQMSYDYLALLVALPIYAAIREKYVRVHPRLVPGTAILLGLVLVIPNQLQDAVDVDTRLFVALTYLFVVALAPVRKEKQVSLAVAAISAFFIGKPLYQGLTSWQVFSAEVTEFRGAISTLPPGSAVLSAYGPAIEDPDVKTPVMNLLYSHLASYATIDRRVFNPLEFTGIGMQPLAASPRYASLDTPAALPLSTEEMAKLKSPSKDLERAAARANLDFAARWNEKFQHVIYYHFGVPGGFDRESLTEVYRGSFFSILEVKRPRGTTAAGTFGRSYENWAFNSEFTKL